MRLSVAIPLLASVLAASSTRAASSFSRDELDSILQTVATAPNSAVFSGVSDRNPPATAASFAAALRAQWAANHRRPDVTAPYLVCDASGVSGYDRSSHIASACGLPEIGDRIVQNLPGRTCFDAQLYPADAQACADVSSFITVVAYTPWLKINAHSFSDTRTESAVRYSASFGDRNLPNQEKIRLVDDARAALEKVWEDTPECWGWGSFAEAFAVDLAGAAISLHQKDAPAPPQSARVVDHTCVLRLVHGLASEPCVGAVQSDPPVTPDNHDGRWIIQGSVTDAAQQRVHPLHEAGITGKDQVVQMSDTGLSVNSCYFYDETGEVVRDRSGTVDSNRRKVVQYYAKINNVDERGHGTHVGGTMVGKVCTGLGCFTLSNRDGIAFDAKIAVYDISRGNGENGNSPDPADPMFTTGVAAGAYVHNASWGNGDHTYTSQDEDFDRFHYRNPEFLFVTSAGNSGGEGLGTVGGVGKNNLNVCNSNNRGNGMGELYVTGTSSPGPSADGRIKPDICAPGCSVSSASHIGSDGSLGRNCLNNILCGTSMASPGVAGAALLIRQYFMDGFYPTGNKLRRNGFTPSAALVKAVILNSGRPMLGRDSSSLSPSAPYDEVQGFGLISLVDGVYLEGRTKGRLLVWDNVKLKNGEEWEETLTLNNCPAVTTSVTLVYMDKENASGNCAECLINRLNLTVQKGSQIFYPNGKLGPDTKNNAQRIRIPQDDVPITVKVGATNLATNSQKFALVVFGCVDAGTSSPTKSAPPSLSPTRTVTPSNLPSLSPTVTCEDDPKFKKGQKKRTCRFIRKRNKQKRINKWCNMQKRGIPVTSWCCKTCIKCTTCFNTSCAHIKRRYPSNGNGEYTLGKTVNGVTKEFKVWCHDMDSDPKEYLSLPATNFGMFKAGGLRQGIDVVSTYTKVRIDVEDLKIDINDRTFQNTVGGIIGISAFTMPYGVAMNCISSGNEEAKARINLSETPFIITSGFASGGSQPGGRADYDSGTNSWIVSGGGLCGWHMPEPNVKNPFAMKGERYHLQLEFE